MTCSIFYTRQLALREKIIQPGKRYAGKYFKKGKRYVQNVALPLMLQHTPNLWAELGGNGNRFDTRGRLNK